MNYTEWLNSVPHQITDDVLWKMEVCRVALFLSDLSWHDSTRLMQDKRTVRLAGQLYAAVGSVSVNISEGYSRQSKKDQARFHEYALGSARESRGWYYQARHVLGESMTTHRLDLTTQIIRYLLRIIPVERGPMLKEESLPYASAITEMPDPNLTPDDLPIPSATT